MRPPDQTRIRSTGVARRHALAAVKSHSTAATLAALTLAAATIVVAQGPQRTSRLQTGIVDTQGARPERVTTPSAVTSPSPPAHGAQTRAAATGRRERRLGHARPGQRIGQALWPHAAGNAAQRFLRTYLPYTYGQLPPRAIQAAAPRLRARIAANPPEVPAAIRRLHPTVTALTIIPARIADAGAGWAATATVTDGPQNYEVTVKVGRQHGRWLVTAILTPGH